MLRKGVKPAILALEKVTAENWREREAFWIASLAGNRLVNSTTGGEGLINPCEDVRTRISRAVSQKLQGNQYRKGIPHDAESKQKISEGLKASEKKRAFNELRRGQPGHPISEETKEKIRQAQLGKKRGPLPPEWIEKIRLAGIGRKQSAETIAKRAATLIGNQRALGFRQTEEAKRKIAAAKLQVRWITRGAEEKQIQPGVFIPKGWKLGRIKKET